MMAYSAVSCSFEDYLSRWQQKKNTFIFHYAQVRIPSMFSFLFVHFYCIIFSHVSFNHYTKWSINETLSNTKRHTRVATECINSIGYALFAVLKAIFSNPNGLEKIMNDKFK